MSLTESQLEEQFTEKLRSLNYACRPDIRDRATHEGNFREKIEALQTREQGLMPQLFPSPGEVEA